MIDWGAAGKQPCRKGSGVLVGSSLYMSQQCAQQHRGQTLPWGASDTPSPAGQERWLSSCTQRWCGLALSTVCSSGPHNFRKMWRSLNAYKTGGRAGRHVLWRAETLSLSSLEKKRLRGNLVAFCSFLRRASVEEGADLFFLGFSYGTSGNDRKLCM